MEFAALTASEIFAPLCVTPVAPHSSTAAHHVLGAAHLTHALALNAALPPLGSAEGELGPGALG